MDVCKSNTAFEPSASKEQNNAASRYVYLPEIVECIPGQDIFETHGFPVEGKRV
jgi:hypothetical protein